MFHVKDLQDVLLSGKQEQNMDSSQYAICVNTLRSTYTYTDICTKGLGGQVIILYILQLVSIIWGTRIWWKERFYIFLCCLKFSFFFKPCLFFFFNCLSLRYSCPLKSLKAFIKFKVVQSYNFRVVTPPLIHKKIEGQKLRVEVTVIEQAGDSARRSQVPWSSDCQLHFAALMSPGNCSKYTLKIQLIQTSL